MQASQASPAQEEGSHRPQFYALFSFTRACDHFKYEELVQEYNRILIL